jgi:hypothetical protein
LRHFSIQSIPLNSVSLLHKESILKSGSIMYFSP